MFAAPLRERLKPICHRTLRRQVTAYVPYTKRLALVEEFIIEVDRDARRIRASLPDGLIDG